MPATEPDQFAALDAQTARLRGQLEAKSSLFDVLSPPPSQPTDAATTEDKKLKSAYRIGNFTCYVLLVITVAYAFIGYGERRSSMWGLLTTPLMLAASVGIHAFIAIRLLRARSISLESEVRQLRAELASFRQSNPT